METGDIIGSEIIISLSAAEVRLLPFALKAESGPIIWLAAALLSPHCEPGSAQRSGGGQSINEHRLVKELH